MYRVVYLWRGERHQHSQLLDTEQEANVMVRQFRNDGWQAWWEHN